MPVPVSYSEPILADYLVSVLGDVAGVLGWDAGTVQVIEALNDALLDYGVSDISAATDMRQLRAFGRRAIWRAVVQAVAGKYDFSDLNTKLTRSQFQEMARHALAMAETDCREWDPSYAATIVSVTRPHDPYAVMPDEERIP